MATNQTPDSTRGFYYFGRKGEAVPSLGLDASGNMTVVGPTGTVLKTFRSDDTDQVTIKVAITASASANNKFAVLNPFGVRAFVEKVIIDVTTKATGAATMNVGTATDATSAPTVGNYSIDTLDVGTAAIVADSVNTNTGTNGRATRAIGATEYVVGRASASTAGLVGFAYITFRKA